MTMLPIAHAGHWAVDLLYVVPLLIAFAVLGGQSLRDRRRTARDGGRRERRPPAPGA